MITPSWDIICKKHLTKICFYIFLCIYDQISSDQVTFANHKMKTLTIFTVILLPLTLIAEVYGMNGVDLSNLGNVSIGFIIVLVPMTAIAAFFVLVF